MRIKRFLSGFLAITLTLSCINWRAASAQNVQTDNTTDSTYTTEISDTNLEALTENSQILDHVDSEQFFNAEHIARLPEEETLDSYVFLNRDGSKSIYYMGQPIKYVDSNGVIQEKDTTLIRSNGGYCMRDNDVALHIPDTVDTGITVAYNNQTVKLTPQGGSGSAQQYDNSIVYYEFYGKGTILRYTPMLSGVKEDIILAKYTGQNSFTFLLETNGLQLYEDQGRYYLAENQDISATFYLGPVEIYDAIGRPDLGTMTAETIIPGQKYRLTISANESFLLDPETVYPVTIDPTLTVRDSADVSGTVEDAPVFSGYANRSFGDYVFNNIGYVDGYKLARTAFRLTSLLADSNYNQLSAEQLNSVSFHLKGSGGQFANLSLHALTENATWTESTLTWNNLGAYSETAYTTVRMGSSVWKSFDITALAKDWKTGAQNSDCGFVLISDSTTSSVSTFSAEYSTVDYRPYVVVNYTSTIALNQVSATLSVGGTLALTATTTPAGQVVSWNSADPTVAEVSENGVVNALSLGTTTITASLEDGTSAECEVTVVAKSISLNYNTSDKIASVYKGETITLIATTEPAGEAVDWVSLNPEIATVANGVVTGISVGTATIKASLEDGTSAQCSIVVQERAKVTLSQSTVYIAEGSTIALTATVEPPISTVTWASSKPAVATVTDSGLVTGLRAGKTTISATLEDGTRATCVVNVTVPDGVYYIRSLYFLYLNVTDGGIANNTDVCQQDPHESDADDLQKIRQMWKISHLGNGQYSIRPLHKMDMGLHVTGDNVDIYQIGATDTIDAIPDDAKWTIEWRNSGYVINNIAKSNLLQQSTLDVSHNIPNPGTSVFLSNDNHTSIFSLWSLINIETPPVGMIVYDTISGTSTTIEKLYVAPQEIRSMSNMNLSLSTYPTLYSQTNISWTSSNQQIVIVDPTTGTITGISPGIATITVTATVYGIPNTMQYTVEVTSIPQGTYFIKNKESGYYVDTESQSLGFGRFVRQEEFYGGQTQKWTFTHLGDGTYSIGIVTQYSAYYLAVNNDSVSNHESIRLWYCPLTDGMKWIIEPTSNDSYIIIPKSGHSMGYVLRATSSQAYSATIEQCSYSNDDLYTDEWHLRIVENAYSIGGEFFDGGDVIDAYNTWKACGYSSDYDINPSTDTLSESNLNSEIVYFSSHGQQHMLMLPNGIYLTDGTIEKDNSVSITDKNLDLTNAKLYIFDACETAIFADGTNVNLCTQTLAAGVECVLGWYCTICSRDAKKWQERFQTALIDGVSVSAAVDYADSFSDYYFNNTIKAHHIYGNENLIINVNNSHVGVVCSLTMSEESCLLKKFNILYPTHDKTELKRILRSEFANFCEGEARITITYTNPQKTNYVVDYLYLYNGYVTACGYTLIVKDGIIMQIQYNNVQTLDHLSQKNTVCAQAHASQITDKVISAAIEQANAEVHSINQNCIITEQYGEMFYDIQEDKYYYKIFTGYKDSNGICGAVVTLYEL